MVSIQNYSPVYCEVSPRLTLPPSLALILDFELGSLSYKLVIYIAFNKPGSACTKGQVRSRPEKMDSNQTLDWRERDWLYLYFLF